MAYPSSIAGNRQKSPSSPLSWSPQTVKPSMNQQLNLDLLYHHSKKFLLRQHGRYQMTSLENLQQDKDLYHWRPTQQPYHIQSHLLHRVQEPGVLKQSKYGCKEINTNFHLVSKDKYIHAECFYLTEILMARDQNMNNILLQIINKKPIMSYQIQAQLLLLQMLKNVK